MRFLHISDLHFGIERRKGLEETSKIIRKNYMATLTEQIRNIVRKEPVDFIVFTGDVAWKASQNEYKDAKQWLTSLLEVCGLKNDKLYICPGNHDINRDKVDELYYPENQAKAREFLCIERLQSRLEERFQEYCQFSEKIKLPQYKIGSVTNRLVGVHEQENYRIVCINTAWYALNDEVQDRMWVGDSFVEIIKNDLKSTKNKPTLTIMHHPKTSWNESERGYYENCRNVYMNICEFSDIVLTGHSHECHPSSENVKDAYVTSVGATYQGEFYQNNFCIYDIDWKGQKKPNRDIWYYNNPKWLHENEYIEEIISVISKNKGFGMICNEKNEQSTDTISKPKTDSNYIAGIDELSFYYLDKIVKDIKEEDKKVKELEKVMTAFVYTSVGKSANLDNIVESMIAENTGKIGLLIKGYQGTGKSTFLSLLYLRLKTKYLLGKINRVPVLIDLHKLDEMSLADARKKIEDDLDVIDKFLKEGLSFYLIFDGCDNYIRVHYELEEMIQTFIAGHNEKFILCIGDIDEKNPEYAKNLIRTPILKEIERSGINLYARGFQERKGLSLERLVKKVLFIESKESLNKKAKDIAKLLNSLDAVEIDFRTIYTFIRIIGMSPDKATTNPGIILYEYFINYFQNNQRLYREARTALLYRTEPDKLNSDLFNNAEALYKNKITRDFLTAYYFLRTILDVKETDIKGEKTDSVTENGDLERICKIEYIFTPEINHMVKDLLVMYQDKQHRIVEQMINIYNDCRSNQNIKLQIAYVLGRITSVKAKSIAIPFLLNEYNQYNKKLYGKKLPNKKRKEMDIVIYRTIAISLLTLGENKYEESYIENLIYDFELNSINRGFNCAYYKDKIYNLGDKPEYKDNQQSPGPIDNTMLRLMSHIEKALNEQNEKERKTLYMEVITVFSLYEVRMSDINIRKKYKDKLLSLADTILNSKGIYSNIVRNYTNAMKELFVEEKPYRYIFKELYNTKFEQRVGWIKRNISHPESVMDHMYSAYLIGMFLLPETKYELEEYKLTDSVNYEAYDKQAILTTVLIHDMGENFIGDKLKKSEDDIKNENNRLEYYGLLCTLPKLHGLGRNVKYWRELYSKETINGKIANDLDKLEPLIQAYMYKVRGEMVDLEEWKKDVEQNLETTLGRKLLDFVINNIL